VSVITSGAGVRRLPIVGFAVYQFRRGTDSGRHERSSMCCDRPEIHRGGGERASVSTDNRSMSSDHFGPGRFAAGQFDRIVCRDSSSAALTVSQRAHAVGSISSSIACSTQLRRSFGSMASISQHLAP
jgi:hypothetical protein